MKTSKVFVAFIFLLSFISGISAQSDSSSLPYTVTSNNKNIELGAVSPNELEGYKFFSEGKLNKLKLGFSTKEDVRKILGEPRLANKNDELYDYDSNWEIKFVYFYESYQGPYRRAKPSLVLASEYVGRIYKIMLFPKKVVSFNEITFPTVFKRGTGNYGGNANYTYFYFDSYSLVYEMFESSTIKNDSRRQGDLIKIVYEIPYNLVQDLLIEPEQISTTQFRKFIHSKSSEFPSQISRFPRPM